ncbi:MAG: cytochrome c [Candidatus Thiodiazotropha sp.]|jgi:cytochrome c556
MKKIAILAAAIVAFGATSIAVSKERDPNERAIAAREAAFTLMAANFGPMGAMAKGKTPFDQEQFAKRAANLEVLSKMPWEFFIPGSDKGDTEAKPEVWSNPDDYKAKAEKFQQEVAKLVEVSKGSDQKAMFAQVGATAKTCKSCHEKYKED